MTTQATVVEVRVRNTCQTYTASAKGQRTTPTAGARPALSASCTAGAEQAVRALAHKVFTDRAAHSEFVRREGGIEFWRITA